MSDYPHPIIAREGWPFIALAFIGAIAVHVYVGWAWAAFPWFIALVVLQFFRDPPRLIPTELGIVVSPADGRIVKVEVAHDPYLDREALKISVFMNVFNVHSNRSPVAGRVEKTWYFAGQFFNAALDKASLENERAAIHLRTSEGHDVTSVQVAGLVARRILCYAKEGQLLTRGERYGFIRFGSRVDVYLPTDAIARVAVGDIVSATETVLASFA